jgi:hypothetical protein
MGMNFNILLLNLMSTKTLNQIILFLNIEKCAVKKDRFKRITRRGDLHPTFRSLLMTEKINVHGS